MDWPSNCFMGRGLNKGQNEGTDGHCVDFNIS